MRFSYAMSRPRGRPLGACPRRAIEGRCERKHSTSRPCCNTASSALNGQPWCTI